MRALGAVAAAFLFVFAIPTAPRADAATKPGYRCVPIKRHIVHHRRYRHHHWRHHRHYVRRHVRHYHPYHPAGYFNTMIPSPYDTAYDRAMVLTMRARPVAGIPMPNSGLPVTPAVYGVERYRIRSGPAVLEYDTMIGTYVPLTPADARRALPPPPPPAPPPVPGPKTLLSPPTPAH